MMETLEPQIVLPLSLANPGPNTLPYLLEFIWSLSKRLWSFYSVPGKGQKGFLHRNSPGLYIKGTTV